MTESWWQLILCFSLHGLIPSPSSALPQGHAVPCCHIGALLTGALLLPKPPDAGRCFGSHSASARVFEAAPKLQITSPVGPFPGPIERHTAGSPARQKQLQKSWTWTLGQSGIAWTTTSHGYVSNDISSRKQKFRKWRDRYFFSFSITLVLPHLSFIRRSKGAGERVAPV